MFTMLPSRVDMKTPIATNEKTSHLLSGDFTDFFIKKPVKVESITIEELDRVAAAWR